MTHISFHPTWYNRNDASPYRLYLARVNLHDPDSRGNELFPQAIREAADGGFGRAVYAATHVRLPTGNTANVYDVAGSAIRSLEKDGKDGLRHVDKSGDIGVEHGVEVILEDFRGLCNAFDQTTVILTSHISF